MKSSVLNDDIGTAAAALAERLLGSRVLSFEPARPGGNNRVYKAETSDDAYAVKIYPDHAAGAHDRLGAEFSACEFLDERGEKSIPRPVACDPVERIGIYQWINGSAVSEPEPTDVDAALEFVTRLRRYSETSSATDIGHAAEACLSAAELVRQVKNRFKRLSEVCDAHRELEDFIHARALPFVDASAARARRGYMAADLPFDDDISLQCSSLSPSDFGFHNSLRRADGAIVFIDFEYFGWDDPVRLVADFLLHPGMNLSDKNCTMFSQGALDVFGGSLRGDGDFPMRFDLLYPLVGARWCAILLNEFLPERWQRRVFANPDLDRETAQHNQLEKARRMLARVEGSLEGFAHDT